MNKVGKFEISGLKYGMYSIEYHLTSGEGKQLARAMELFYIE